MGTQLRAIKVIPTWLDLDDVFQKSLLSCALDKCSPSIAALEGLRKDTGGEIKVSRRYTVLSQNLLNKGDK